MKTKFIYVFPTYLIIDCQLSISARGQVNKGKKANRTSEQFMKHQTHQMVKTLMSDDAAIARFIPIYQNYLRELRECRMVNRKQTPAR